MFTTDARPTRSSSVRTQLPALCSRRHGAADIALLAAGRLQRPERAHVTSPPVAAPLSRPAAAAHGHPLTHQHRLLVRSHGSHSPRTLHCTRVHSCSAGRVHECAGAESSTASLQACASGHAVRRTCSPTARRWLHTPALLPSSRNQSCALCRATDRWTLYCQVDSSFNAPPAAAVLWRDMAVAERAGAAYLGRDAPRDRTPIPHVTRIAPHSHPRIVIASPPHRHAVRLSSRHTYTHTYTYARGVTCMVTCVVRPLVDAATTSPPPSDTSATHCSTSSFGRHRCARERMRRTRPRLRLSNPL
jgi:hypothetical protein